MTALHNMTAEQCESFIKMFRDAPKTSRDMRAEFPKLTHGVKSDFMQPLLVESVSKGSRQLRNVIKILNKYKLKVKETTTYPNFVLIK